MTASHNRRIFKTFMRAERKEPSTVMMANTFPMTATGPFDYLDSLIREKARKWPKQKSLLRIVSAWRFLEGMLRFEVIALACNSNFSLHWHVERRDMICRVP